MFLASGPPGDVSSVLLEHILDSTRLSLLPGVASIALPFDMGVHSLMVLVALTVLCGVCVWAVRKPTLKPRGVLLGLEMLVLFIRDDIVYPILGKERGRRWLPFFTGLFVFILFLNLIGLVPAFKAATGNIAVTSALAILVLILIFGVGIIRLGPLGFFKNLYPSGTPLAIGLFVAFLEFVGTLIKCAVLSLRLFANMFAGHLAILSFLVLMMTVSPAFVVVSIPFAVFTYVLEVLISLIQALVFTLLSCLFIQMASTSHEESHE